MTASNRPKASWLEMISSRVRTFATGRSRPMERTTAEIDFLNGTGSVDVHTARLGDGNGNCENDPYNSGAFRCPNSKALWMSRNTPMILNLTGLPDMTRDCVKGSAPARYSRAKVSLIINTGSLLQ